MRFNKVLDSSTPGSVQVAVIEPIGNRKEVVPVLVRGGHVLSIRELQSLADQINKGGIELPRVPELADLPEGARVVVTFLNRDGTKFDTVEPVWAGCVCLISIGWSTTYSFKLCSDGTFFDQGLVLGPEDPKPVHWQLREERPS